MNDRSDDPSLPLVDWPISDISVPGYQGGKDFYINYDAVGQFTALIDRVADRATNYESYFNKYTTLEDGEGWFNNLSGAHETVVETTSKWLAGLSHPVMSRMSYTVRRARLSFHDVDSDAAVKIDALVEEREVLLGPAPNSFTNDYISTMLESAGVEIDRYEGAFEEPRISELPKPGDHEDLPSEPPYAPTIDVATAIRQSIISVTRALTWIGLMSQPWDPYEAAVKAVVGDWAGLARTAEVLRTVGKAVDDEAFNIDRARHLLEPFWRGRAADACVVLLGSVVEPTQSAREGFNNMADEYDKAAEGAADFRHAVESVLDAIIDAAAVLAITIVASGSAAAPTAGGSVVVGGVVSAVEIYGIITSINKINDAYNFAVTAWKTAESAMKDFGQLDASKFLLAELPRIDPASNPLAVLPKV